MNTDELFKKLHETNKLVSQGKTTNEAIAKTFGQKMADKVEDDLTKIKLNHEQPITEN